MVLLRRALPDARFGEGVFAVHPRKVPKARKAIRAVVREEWLCTRRLPENGVRAPSPNSRTVWFCDPPLGRHADRYGPRATVPGLGWRRPERRNPADARRRQWVVRGKRRTAESYGTMMRDSSRFRSWSPGNCPRKNSMKRRERGRPFARKSPIRNRNTSNGKISESLKRPELCITFCFVSARKAERAS